MAAIIKREKIEGKPDKITLVVDGIRKQSEGIDIFRQEYSAKQRSRDLFVPGVSLEVVKDGDYDSILMCCWFSEAINKVILDIRGKKGFKRHTLKGFIRAKIAKAHIREIREEAWARSERDAKENL